MSILMKIWNCFKTVQLCISWWKNFDNYQDARYVFGVGGGNFHVVVCPDWPGTDRVCGPAVDYELLVDGEEDTVNKVT